MQNKTLKNYSDQKWSRHAGGPAESVVIFLKGRGANDYEKKILEKLYKSRLNMNSVQDVAVTPPPSPHSNLYNNNILRDHKTPGEHITTATQNVKNAAKKTANIIANTATNRISKLTKTVTDAANKLTDSVSNLRTTASATLQQAVNSDEPRTLKQVEGTSSPLHVGGKRKRRRRKFKTRKTSKKYTRKTSKKYTRKR